MKEGRTQREARGECGLLIIQFSLRLCIVSPAALPPLKQHRIIFLPSTSGRSVGFIEGMLVLHCFHPQPHLCFNKHTTTEPQLLLEIIKRFLELLTEYVFERIK